MGRVPNVNPDDGRSIAQAIARLSKELAETASPTFGGLTLTGELNMSDNPITDVGYIDFNLDNGIASAEGRLVWNDDDGTLNLGMPGGSVNLQIGQEMLLRVTNNTGSIITNGTPVYISGATGTNITIEPATATFATAVAFRTIGIATEDIAASGGKGYVTTGGFVRDIDTDFAAAAGMPAYLAVGGGFTTSPPAAPNPTILMGVVTRKSASAGEIYVNLVSIPTFNSLSDVKPASADKNIIQWVAATSTWDSGANLDLDGTVTATGLTLSGDLDLGGNNLLNPGTGHDAFTDFVADEHIDHTTVSISAGGILSGGGTIAANRTISLAHGDVDHNQTLNFVANKHFDHTLISVLSGGILSGGGTIAADRTISLAHGDVDHDQTLNFVANKHIDWTNATDNLVTTGTLQGATINLTTAASALMANSVVQLNFAGTNNAAIGASAGNTGVVARQAAFGTFAGQNATAHDQAAFGYLAGQGNTGDRSAQMGREAGLNNTGAFQSALGNKAGAENIGIYQAVLGLQAGYLNRGTNQTSFGVSAGQENQRDNQTALGWLAGYLNGGNAQHAVGYRCGQSNAGDYQTVMGFNSGKYNDGNNNTAFGAETFNVFELDVANVKTFDNTDIDVPNNRVTLTGHSLGAVGVYRCLRYVKGTSIIPGFTTSAVHLFLIIDANTVELISDVMTAQGIGVNHTFTPQFVYTNSTALGYNAEPTASNQMMLGDTNITEAVTYGTLVLPKTAGMGIKVDPAAPTFGWRDLLGPVTYRGAGATDPSLTTYRGGIKQFLFAVNDEGWFEFHMPHDYAPGTDVHIHVHWSHISTAVTGGSITWGFEASYAKGHDQAAFSAPVSSTVVGNASTTQYQHIITELQLSAASPSASQLDSDDLEIDGVILLRAYLNANNITSSGAVPDAFVHYVDIHYQSTGIATKEKSPDFYA